MIDTFEKIWSAINGDGRSSSAEIIGALEDEISRRGALMSKLLSSQGMDEQLKDTGREREAFIEACIGFNGQETPEKSEIWREARAKLEEMERDWKPVNSAVSKESQERDGADGVNRADETKNAARASETSKLKGKEREEKAGQSTDVNETSHGEQPGVDSLRFQAQQERAAAQRASEILDGAALIPDGPDSNLPNADLDSEQEAVKSSIDKANIEVREMRSSAASKEDAASRNTSEAAVFAKRKMGPGVIVTTAQKGRTYTGRIIGLSGSHPDTLAIQRISGNQAVLHRIKDIASESDIAVGAELSITRGRDGKAAARTRGEISKAKDSREYDAMERER